jgi:hypothetical protein
MNATDIGGLLSPSHGSLFAIGTLIYDFLVMGQLALGPGTCAALARGRYLGPAVLVAMGSSAVLMLNHEVVENIAQAYDVVAPILSLVCIAPLVIVLRNKRTQLPAGRRRHTWALLMSVSILMFSSATLVPALIHMSSTHVAPELAWSSLLVIAGMIGWAWPKGREVVEEVAEEIIERAL